MKREEFIKELRKMLSGLPKRDAEERISFYCEMIDDKIEAGIPEERAVAELGSARGIAEQIIKDLPKPSAAAGGLKPKRRLRGAEIALIALGSPIWLSLAIAALAVVISIYAVIWSILISVYAVFISVAVGAPFAVLSGFIFAFSANGFAFALSVGCGIFLSGLAIFLFFGCKAMTLGVLKISAAIALGIKKLFIR